MNHRHTEINAGQSATLISGRDTTLSGAQVSGERIVAQVGGDLTIHSVQDTATYDSQHRSAGGSVTIGYGFAASASYSNARVEADHASVSQQSGLRAGDQGFQVEVKGHTELQGAVIASTQAAVDEGRNRLATGTLRTGDLQNKDVYKASSTGVSAGTSGASAGHASVDGQQSSTTRSGISGGEIVITDSPAQQERTGQTTQQTLAALNREVLTGDDSGALSKRWDGQELQKQVQAGAQIVATFGQQASKAVGDYATNKARELRQQGNEEEARKWDEGGAYRVAAHIAVGGLSGGLEGALGSGSSAAAVPHLAEAINAAGLPEPVRQAVVAAAGTAVGALTGDTTGATTGFNQTANNYLRHEEAARRAQLMEQKLACKDAACAAALQQEIDRLNALDAWRDQQIAEACQSPGSALCSAWVADIQSAAGSYLGQGSSNTLINAERSSVLNDAFKYQQANANPLLHGVGKGLLKLSPPGLVVGTGVGAYELVKAIVDNGALDTAIQIAQGIADIPTDLRNRLNSPDPTVRGEALVDTLALGAGTTALTGKLTQAGYAGVARQVEAAAGSKVAGRAEGKAPSADTAQIKQQTIENNVYRDADLTTPVVSGAPGEQIRNLVNTTAQHPSQWTVQIGGRTLTPAPALSKNQPVYSGVSDAEVLNFVNSITGGAQPSHTFGVNGVPNAGQTWSLSDGSKITLRSQASSTQQLGPHWTVEIESASVYHKKPGKAVEFKFLR
ncbi:MAG: hemagglutinin repeat-containing protein [Caldimonas sp.]|uniref:hemagglutinin repeat-containing protein n=1 Tax=Caldimonas sp. TaxID=2838790 RepID=UPI0039193C58